MKRLIVSAWRWSWLVTLPATAFAVLWALKTFQTWRTFAVDYDPRPIPVSLREFGIDRWNTMTRAGLLSLRPTDLNDVPLEHQLRTVQLHVGEPRLAQLNANLPYSGLEFVDGLLAYPDGVHEVRVRYRGDFLSHWAHDKKSWRVRTDADDLFAGMRDFNLVVPKFAEQVNNYLAYRLAAQLGLIVPRCELVNVFLNGRNLGVHEFTEQLGEGTLRAHDRMPGDLYAGEFVAKDALRGTSNRVFDLPLAWEKIAANNHYDLESRVPLERLTALLNGSPDAASQARLSQLLDMDAWGRFGAFELLCQTHHFDEAHNWRLFWDPWRLKFEPVVWDPTGWTPDSRSADGSVAPDLVITRLHMWLVSNGDYVAARHAALHEFLDGPGAERFLAEFDATMQKVRHALAYDPFVRPTSMPEVEGALADFRPYVERIFASLRAAHLTPGAVRWARAAADIVRFEVEGRVPVSGLTLRFERPLDAGQAALLRVRQFGRVQEVDLTPAVTVSDGGFHVPARLMSQLVPEFRFLPEQALRQHGRRADPGTYDLVLPGLPADNRLLEVTVARAERRDAATSVAEIPARELEYLFRATVPPRSKRAEAWRGEVLVEGVREVLSDVEIAAGTVVRLAPGASLLFRGRVQAEGTREQPIVFRRADAAAPWGTVALNSPDCRGSTLRWCVIEGGTGYKPLPGDADPRAGIEEYCSMLSIHNCVDVRVEDCVLRDNQKYDDVVHAMYAGVTFERTTIDGAMSDALDCDISEVVIRDCRFRRSSNDGVDLMTTRALIHDCEFVGNGDKGISIGEGSSLIALRNRFDGCNKAMEAKDGSVAHAVNCEIRRCKKAMNAYKKNWRYDAGGSLTVHKSIVVDNRSLPTADTWSTAVLVDCQITGSLAAEYDQEYVDGTSTRMRNAATLRECTPAPEPAARAAVAFPAELGALRELAGAAWQAARGDVRGVPRE